MKNNISRRDFLKITGAGASAVALASCGRKAADVAQGSSADSSEKGEMEYRINPNTSDKVSLLGYGCMRWPMIKDKDGKDIIDQEAVDRLIDHALENGINYFDTAPMYLQGLSEEATAKALARHPRNSYFLATKMSNFGDTSFKGSKEMYLRSMKRLQTDYIDYYLLHSLGGGGIENFNKRFVDNGVIDFLLKEREAGRIRNLGFSYHGDTKCFDELMKLHEKYHWDFVMIQMNYMDWTHASGNNADAKYLYDELEKRGIPVNIMEPLLGGRLAKVPDHIANRLKERNPQGSIASWAFRFVGSHKGVLCALSGMTYMEHLEDNLKTFSPLKWLTEEEFAFLEHTARLLSEYPTVPCNDCKYCMPCPYGIDIPAILLHYNKCVNEGDVSDSSQDPDYRKSRRAYLVSYDRAVPKLRQADHCIGCRQCVEHCPQRINIPQQLIRINRYIEELKQETL